MLIEIAVPNRDDFKGEMVATLFQLACLKKFDFRFYQPQTCYLDQTRSMSFFDAREIGADWLLFLDTDNSVEIEGDVLTALIESGHDIMTGVYVQKTPPYRPVVYKFHENGLIENFVDIPDEPFQVDATGAGFLLISRKVLEAFTPEVVERLGKPFEFMNYGKPNELREDAAFCRRAKELGFDVWAFPHIPMGHIGKQKFTLAHWNAMKQANIAAGDSVPAGIPGWMTEEELLFLKSSANTMDSIVEIGSWKGRSTKALLDAGRPVVYAVDHWLGSDTIKGQAQAEDVYGEFLKNVGHYANLRVLKMSSLEAVKRFDKSNGEPDHVDMVFIDGSHDYESVKADIEIWLPKTKRLICGHDFAKSWPGVCRAVIEKFGQVRLTGSIWWVELPLKQK